MAKCITDTCTDEPVMSYSTNKISAERLRELVIYCPDAGLFCCRNPDGSMGEVLGNKSFDGYVVLRLDGISCLAHRMAWLYVHGCIPSGVVDHVNGNRSDNRIENLRVVSAWRNQHNNCMRRRDGGLVGTYWHHDAKWEARTAVQGKRVFLGFFPTERDAYEAYMSYNKSIGRE